MSRQAMTPTSPVTGRALDPQCLPHSRQPQHQPREHHHGAGNVALGGFPPAHGPIVLDVDHARKLGLREADGLAGGLEFRGGHSALDQPQGALADRRPDRQARREAGGQIAEGIQIAGQRFLRRALGKETADQSLRRHIRVARLEFIELGVEAVMQFCTDLGHRRLRIWRAPVPLRRTEYRAIGPVYSTGMCATLLRFTERAWTTRAARLHTQTSVKGRKHNDRH